MGKYDQQQIPELETPKNKKVHDAAIRYMKRRDERMAKNKEEKEAHTTLLEIMDKEGLTSYTHGDLEVHIDSNRKVKVKVEGQTAEDE